LRQKAKTTNIDMRFWISFMQACLENRFNHQFILQIKTKMKISFVKKIY